MAHVPEHIVRYVRVNLEEFVKEQVEGYLRCLDDCFECMEIAVTDDLLEEDINPIKLKEDFLTYIKEKIKTSLPSHQ